jgi:tetratricopeptide (TPR) repeat protein
MEDQNGIAYTREDLAQVLTSQGDYACARGLLEEDLLLYSALGKPYRTAYPLYNLARVLFLSRNDLAKANAMAKESLSLFQEVGNRRLIAYVLSLLGEILLQKGELVGAREFSEQSVASFRELEYRIGIAESLINLARVEAFQGDLSKSRVHYEESWKLLRVRDSKELRAACLEGLGAAVALQGSPEWAARLWGTAATIRADIGAPMPPVYRVSFGRAVAVTRPKVGEEAFAAAWVEGRNIPLEQALAAPASHEFAMKAYAPGRDIQSPRPDN